MLLKTASVVRVHVRSSFQVAVVPDSSFSLVPPRRIVQIVASIWKSIFIDFEVVVHSHICIRPSLIAAPYKSPAFTVRPAGHSTGDVVCAPVNVFLLLNVTCWKFTCSYPLAIRTDELV